MYLSPDEARSDFFLAAIAFVIGPFVVELLLDAFGPGSLNATALQIILIVRAVLITAAVPIWLTRYRKQPLSTLWSGGARSLGLGALLALPIIAFETLTTLLRGGGSPFDAIALLSPGLELVQRLALYVGLALLIAFLAQRAPEAFRPFTVDLDVALRQAAAVIGAVAFGATLLLWASRNAQALLMVPVVGVAATYLLAERLIAPKGITDRWAVWAPPIVLAVGPFTLFAQAAVFLANLRAGAILAAFALIGVMAFQARRGTGVIMGLLLVLGLFSSVGQLTI